jgi:hypothetical protein
LDQQRQEQLTNDTNVNRQQGMENDCPFPQVNQKFPDRTSITDALKLYSMTAHVEKAHFRGKNDTGADVTVKCNVKGCLVL